LTDFYIGTLVAEAEHTSIIREISSSLIDKHLFPLIHLGHWSFLYQLLIEDDPCMGHESKTFDFAQDYYRDYRYCSNAEEALSQGIYSIQYLKTISHKYHEQLRCYDGTTRPI
jgi:hypothetical protein